ncbi:glycoside hydrolase family 3 C-terminal domain-containing protein [Mucilaginibacter mali]|uniref:Glycoside hydrolase family 3 C-terminal domain-containing protein n=1 Tax=Mucilaginibacter mali TaxID=2740462 RepID=A0A7D4UFZ7_9SPHI|nr:glycoside hydrolase family 3 C-terminal domain-containing protein [Mucilaginibacter mali]QKJ31096.1 glycoside hydrolase family 3 C-terminal domain-containing protein [Mucilaginibacter mali]
MKKLLSGLVAVLLIPGVMNAQTQKGIYRSGWIDLNKNGRKDIYEDPSRGINERIASLLSQMTLEEKTCQMATLYGWKRVLKDSLPTPGWKNEIWKDGIANIDEHLNGFIGWGKLSNSNLAANMEKHIWAMNETQRFFIEQTRLGIPTDFTNEGIRGVEAYEATGFPTQLNMGMTWDKDLVYQEGLITGKEARALGYTNVYAPILDVARDQRWGRLEESYGEDPYLVARLGVAMAKGMQDHNQIASTVKHFAVYSANKGAREGFARTDPQVAPREVENILLYPFKHVFKEAAPMGVMSSYNDYDGIPISGSDYWLIKRLREEMHFAGYVVSDSDALEYLSGKHHVAANLKDAVYQAFMAGMNVRTTFRKPDSIIIYLRQLVNEGRIPIDTINSRVKDVLRVKFKLGLFDHPYVENAAESRKLVNSAAHQTVALKASLESIVLLKNKGNILPLSKTLNRVAVIGPNATNDDYAHTHYGPLMSPSVNVLQGIQNKLGNNKVSYTKGADLVDKTWPESEILPQPMDKREQAMVDSAVQVAQSADAVVVVLGGNTRTAGENKSRISLDLPGHQLDLIKAVKATGKPVVVVLIGTQPMTINWIDKYVDGIIYAGYPGVKGGTAIADVLFGDYNPGGKLTLTFPKAVGQLPLNFPSKPSAQTDDGEEAKAKGLLYPFGFGLSYTSFAYSNLSIAPVEKDGADIQVTVDVTNTGKVAGDEVVQIYIRDVLSSVTTYEKLLKGFDRVHLAPGEKRSLHFSIPREELKLYNRKMEFVLEPGEFKVMAGSSSADIRQTRSFFIK